MATLPRPLPDFNKRPACPRCGVQHAIRHGAEWLCGKCGKCWVREVIGE